MNTEGKNGGRGVSGTVARHLNESKGESQRSDAKGYLVQTDQETFRGCRSAREEQRTWAVGGRVRSRSRLEEERDWAGAGCDEQKVSQSVSTSQSIQDVLFLCCEPAPIASRVCRVYLRALHSGKAWAPSVCHTIRPSGSVGLCKPEAVNDRTKPCSAPRLLAMFARGQPRLAGCDVPVKGDVAAKGYSASKLRPRPRTKMCVCALHNHKVASEQRRSARNLEAERPRPPAMRLPASRVWVRYEKGPTRRSESAAVPRLGSLCQPPALNMGKVRTQKSRLG